MLFSGHFNKDKKTIKHEAFMPNIGKGITSISVFRVSGCSEEKIWMLGEKYVATPRRRELYARGDLKARHAYNISLDVEDEPKPHVRHANITKFPSAKSQAKLKAMELAQNARLVLNTRP